MLLSQVGVALPSCTEHLFEQRWLRASSVPSASNGRAALCASAALRKLDSFYLGSASPKAFLTSLSQALGGSPDFNMPAKTA